MKPLFKRATTRADKCPRVGSAWGAAVLRVTTLHASSAAATAEYYAAYLTKAPGEVPGLWSGRQAIGLGLARAGGCRQLGGVVVGP